MIYLPDAVLHPYMLFLRHVFALSFHDVGHILSPTYYDEIFVAGLLLLSPYLELSS